MQDSSRRSILKAGLGGLLGLSTGILSAQRSPSSAPSAARRGLKVIFMTDTHVGNTDQLRRAQRAFEMAQALRPDLVLFGGDNVMNVDGNKTFEQAQTQFGLWTDLVKSTIRAPHHAVIGNHDIWWAPAGHAEATRRDKGYALEAFALPHRYARVTAAGWTFLLLDVFHRDGCYVDAEQLEWLERELARGSGPVCLVSHAPILSASHFMELGDPKNGRWEVPTSWQVGNSVPLMKLFLKHPRVALALSGHMHHVERLEYHGVTYVCGGAVSGAWWGGDYHAFGPAFIELDLDAQGLQRMRTHYWEKR